MKMIRLFRAASMLDIDHPALDGDNGRRC